MSEPQDSPEQDVSMTCVTITFAEFQNVGPAVCCACHRASSQDTSLDHNRLLDLPWALALRAQGGPTGSFKSIFLDSPLNFEQTYDMLTNKSKHFWPVIHQEPSLFKAQDVLVQMEGGHESLTMAELSITDHGFCDECADTVQEIAPWCSLDEAKSMCTESETFKSKICEATEFRTGREPATWLTDDQCARTFGNETQHWIESQSTSVKRRFAHCGPMAKHRRLPWKAESQPERLEVPVVKTESQPKVPVVKTESQPETEEEVLIASILVENPLPTYKSADPEKDSLAEVLHMDPIPTQLRPRGPDSANVDGVTAESLQPPSSAPAEEGRGSQDAQGTSITATQPKPVLASDLMRAASSISNDSLDLDPKPESLPRADSCTFSVFPDY